MAGLDSKDIDLVELHDCFATAEMLHYENLGLCEDGQAGRLIDEGEVELGGRIPVNVSGGLLSKGHPLGATGAMILGTVLDELERRDLNTALINLCVGGGMGTATIIERV